MSIMSNSHRPPCRQDEIDRAVKIVRVVLVASCRETASADTRRVHRARGAGGGAKTFSGYRLYADIAVRSLTYHTATGTHML